MLPTLLHVSQSTAYVSCAFATLELRNFGREAYVLR